MADAAQTSAQDISMTYTKLSEILAQFPEHERRRVYSRLKQQIKRRQLRAVLTLGWVQLPHKDGPRRVPDLLVELAAAVWIQHVQTELSSAAKRRSLSVLNSQSAKIAARSDSDS